MITGFVSTIRRTIADRPQPSTSHQAKAAMAFRAAMGPGYQVGVTDRVLHQASRR